MPSIRMKITAKDVELWSKRTGRRMAMWIRADLDKLATAGVGPDGGQYAKYETPGEEHQPVRLTQSGEMLGLMKISVKAGHFVIKPGMWYGKFQQFGTIDPDALKVEQAELRAARKFRQYNFKKRRKGRKLKSEEKGHSKPGGSIPARPFMVFRPQTIKKLERDLARILERAFKAKSLKEIGLRGRIART